MRTALVLTVAALLLGTNIVRAAELALTDKKIPIVVCSSNNTADGWCVTPFKIGSNTVFLKAKLDKASKKVVLDIAFSSTVKTSAVRCGHENNIQGWCIAHLKFTDDTAEVAVNISGSAGNAQVNTSWKLII